MSGDILYVLDQYNGLYILRATLPPVSAFQSYLQEGINGYTGVADTYLYAWQPTLVAGQEETLQVTSGNVRNTLLSFDLSAVPAGAFNIWGGVQLYVTQAPPVPFQLALYPLLKPWDEESATWYRATENTNWAVPGANALDRDRAALPSADTSLPMDRWVALDISDLLRDWLADPGSNEGVWLQGLGEPHQSAAFVSSESPDRAHQSPAGDRLLLAADAHAECDRDLYGNRHANRHRDGDGVADLDEHVHCNVHGFFYADGYRDAHIFSDGHAHAHRQARDAY